MKKRKKIVLFLGLIYTLSILIAAVYPGSLALKTSSSSLPTIGINKNKSFALTSSQIQSLANKYCQDQISATNITPIDKKICTDGYIAGYNNTAKPNACDNNDACKNAYAQGRADKAKANTPSQSNQDIANLAYSYCYPLLHGTNGGALLLSENTCEAAYTAGFNQKSIPSGCSTNDACKAAYNKGHADGQANLSSFASQCQGWTTTYERLACQAGVDGKNRFDNKDAVCGSYKDSSSTKQKTACEGGWNNTTVTVTQAMKDACADYKNNNTYYNDCLAGYTGALNCSQGTVAGSQSQKACQAGKSAAQQDNSSGDDTSACIAHSSTTLEWLLCPLITALSKGADQINTFVEKELNFDTGNFLPKSGNNAGAYRAWTVIKDLVTSVLIVLLLVMVISQALGNGIFEAYTVKKVLPRLVIAVIGMQLSWDLCIFVINIADHLGEGLAQIMAAPFGGRGNLDLDSLLAHLGTVAAIGTEVTLMAILVSTIFIGPILAPGALLVAFSLMMAVLIGLASVLFRNIIIIACVVLSPLAILLWVMPGKSLQGYYKTWSDNFTKCLLLFPLMIGIIYGGRIFAYIAGGSKNVGFLNLIMILVGFFGPYFILPKAFKWGGSWMKAGADAIANNAAVKKGGELGRKELLDVLRRKQGDIASQYNPDDKMLTFRRGKMFGKIPVPVAGGRLGTRIQSGAILPTERNRRLAIKKGDEWKNERNDEALAYNKRKMEMGFSKGYEHDYIDENGNKVHEKIEPGLKAGKQALVDMAGYDGDDPLMKRAAEMAVVQLLESNSYWELQNSRIGGTGKYAGLRVQDTEAWQKKLQTTPDMWSKASKRPDTIPTVTSEEYGGDDDEKTLQILAKYAPEKYTGKTDADWKRYKDAHKEYFKVEDDGKGNIKKGYLARRLDDVHKKQAQLKGTPARLDDADRQTKALRDGYADAASSAGYAEGWWDEMKDQRAKGNTAASEEMLKQLIQTAANGQAGLSTLNPLSNGQLRDKVNEALGGAKNNDILGALITAANTANSRPDAAKAILDHLKVNLDADAAIKAGTNAGAGKETLPEPAIPTTTTPAATESGGSTTTAPAGATSSASSSSGGGPTGGGGAATPGTTGPAPGAGYGTMPLNEANMEHFGRAMERAVTRGIESSRMGRAGAQPRSFEVQNIPAPTVETPRQETVVRLANEGELRISHRPGEVTPGGVILPTGVRDSRNEPPAGS